MKTHELKTWPPFFQQMVDGLKLFEIRRNDRDFEVGDTLRLREYDPGLDHYSGREIRAEVTSIVAEQPWVPEGYVAMGIRITEPSGRTVGDIIRDYLKAHGFDGLWCCEGDPCGCALEDLAPCGEMSEECRTGYLKPCDCGGGCSFHIGRDKAAAEVTA